MMTRNEIKVRMDKTVFPLGYAEDIHADLYSVYHGEKQGKGIWSIYILERNHTVAMQSNIGTFTGLTLKQLKGDN